LNKGNDKITELRTILQSPTITELCTILQSPTKALKNCTEFGNFVITLIYYRTKTNDTKRHTTDN